MQYRLIYSQFWSDPKVMEEMTPEDKLFYLYILTNVSTTNCGIYMITKKQMAFDMGYSVETVNCLMDRFINKHKLIAYNPTTYELAIKNWGRYNLNRGGKPVIDCLTSELGRVKDKKHIEYIYDGINSGTIKELYGKFCDKDTTREREVAPQVDNTDTYTNTNKDTNKDTDTSVNTKTSVNTSTYLTTNMISSTKLNTHINTNVETNTFINNGDENSNRNTDLKPSLNKYSNQTAVTDVNTYSKFTKEDYEAHNHSLTLIQDFEKITGNIGSLNLASVKMAVIQHGHSNVEKAIRKALEKGKSSMSYINGILRTWAKEGYPKEGENNGIRNTYKDHENSKSEYGDFKPPKPRTLSDEERRAVEEELL
jgi:DnaD/phage-associated family protein